ncbi:MAG: hypothetical protein ACRELE_09655 [Gemmatimonadales bacterium]
MRPLIVLALALLGAPIAGRAQTLKKCDEPKVLIGVLPRGAATVWYRLAKDGRPDTSSLGVVEVHGLSASELRSVAARILSACRFDVPKQAAASELVTSLNFDSATVSLGTTNRAEDPPPPQQRAEVFDLSPDSLPLLATDHRIEERPRLVQCHSTTPNRISVERRRSDAGRGAGLGSR